LRVAGKRSEQKRSADMDHMKTNKGGYASLIVQTIISGVITYLVMFVMIDGLDSFSNNLNMLYMTVMMVAPMVVLMIMAMPHLFPSRGANTAILAGAIIVSSAACPDPHPDDDRRSRIPSLDDSAPLGYNPDVSAGETDRP
jgi:hypothetical protein